MEPTTNEHLHIVAGLLVAALFALLVIAKVGGKFLDDWWDKGKPKNGNGSVAKNNFNAEDATERIIELFGERHDRLREMIHQNHAATLAVLTELSRILSSRTQTESDIAITLKLIERHMAKTEERLDGRPPR
jgi:hypothetical protein